MKPAPSISIRAAHDDDFDDIAAIEASAHPYAWELDVLRRHVAHPCALTRVLIAEDKLAAFAISLVEDRTLHLANLAVSTDLRRRGYGSEMVEHIVTLAHELGLDDVRLEVRETNLAAQLLYRRAGFRAIGILKAYYGSEDGYDMRRSLHLPGHP
jgi:ribosomal-protein-alanine N-acetyltransferase